MYLQQAHHLVLRLPEDIEETVRTRLREGSMEGISLTARPDGIEGLPEWAVKKGGLLQLNYDDKIYPARLVNLPCIVEVHKTIDNVTLFKSGDVGQMVIVYANEEGLLVELQKERDEMEKKNREKMGKDGDVSACRDYLDEFYHSGLTPPTTNIVKRRFKETRMHGPYPPEIVSKVQKELAAHVSALEEKKEIAEIVEDVVDFEDYMADLNGQALTITEDSLLWLEHPELMIHHPVKLNPDDPIFNPPAPSQPPAPGAAPMIISAVNNNPLLVSTTGGLGGGSRGRGSRGRGGGGSLSKPSRRKSQQQQQQQKKTETTEIIPPPPVRGRKLPPEETSNLSVSLPIPPPARRNKQQQQPVAPGRNLGGRRVGRGGGHQQGGQVLDLPPPPPILDLPPHEDPPLEDLFGGEGEGGDDDDFFKFLEGGAGEEGGFLDFSGV